MFPMAYYCSRNKVSTIYREEKSEVVINCFKLYKVADS